MRRFLLRIAAAVPAVALACCSGHGASAVPATGAAVHRAAQTAITGASGFAGMRAAFLHSLICDNGKLIAAYAKAYGITTIFVPVGGDDITSLLGGNPTTTANLRAMLAVANVYLVTGSPSWLTTPTTEPADAASTAKIAKVFPGIAGVLYAVDPEQSPSWNSNRASVIQSYFTLANTLLSASGASSFKQTLFIAHIDFSTNAYGSGSMLAQLQSLAGVTGTALIVPGNSESTQYANVSPALPQLTKPFWIEASASKYDPASYNGVTPSYLSQNLTSLQQAVAAQNPQIAGIEVNGWNDLYNDLQSVLAQPAVFNGTLANGPYVPAAGTTYLGAFVNPAGTGPSPAQTAAFEQQIGRTLAYNMHFYEWKAAFPGANEADDIAHGRIPVIAWNCGDSDARVAAGNDDATIVAAARAIKAFGHPVFLRWFWEMNLDDTNNAPRTQCYDPKTDLAGGYFSPMKYIAAWSHIRSVFAGQGATNVVWLWCVANAHGGPSQYYPGDTQVDWVAMDDYDTNDVSMPATFFILSNELAQFQQKPFMITETGAHPANQPNFLAGGASVLQSQFPWARAIGYLDAPGTHQDWVLSTAGLTDFTTFANDPYMKAMPSPL